MALRIYMKNRSEIDALFALPLADFTAARNAMAARLKKEGRAIEAEQVKALTKPSATAWAVNQLYWRHRGEFDRLVAVNEQVRDAQMRGTGDLRALLDERRTMLSELASIGASLLSEKGNAASVDARRRVATTLESLVARDRVSIEEEAGRLTADLDPLGFESLLGVAPAAHAKVLDFTAAAKEKQSAREKQNAEAERARARAEELKVAEAALAQARREAARAEEAVTKARARLEAVEEAKAKIEERLMLAMHDARAAEDDVKKSARALAEAERAVERAREKE